MSLAIVTVAVLVLFVAFMATISLLAYLATGLAERRRRHTATAPGMLG